jgi:catechol 2,3-dioxygenase-like lactoylglutathione lyase family enzyme
MKNLSINYLDHVALEVKDMAKAMTFYTDVLVLEQLETPESVKTKGVRWLRLNETQALHLVENKNITPGQVAHIALNVDDVSTWRDYIESKGIKLDPPKFSMYQAERFFIHDPSGNRIEFLKWY